MFILGILFIALLSLTHTTVEGQSCADVMITCETDAHNAVNRHVVNLSARQAAKPSIAADANGQIDTLLSKAKRAFKNGDIFGQVEEFLSGLNPNNNSKNGCICGKKSGVQGDLKNLLQIITDPTKPDAITGLFNQLTNGRSCKCPNVTTTDKRCPNRRAAISAYEGCVRRLYRINGKTTGPVTDADLTRYKQAGLESQFATIKAASECAASRNCFNVHVYEQVGPQCDIAYSNACSSKA